MGRFPNIDLDVDSIVKRSRKNRKYVKNVVDKFRELSDSKWWSFDENNVFTGAKIVFNTNADVKLYPVTLGLNEDLYQIQFVVNNDDIIAKSLKADHANNIDNLIASAESFNRTQFNGELPKKIRLRLNSKKYLKFLNQLELEAKHLLANIKIPSSKESICLVLTIAFLCNNYARYVDLPYTESELVEKFFERFHAGLTPEIALITIVENIDLASALKYADVPTSWVEQVTGLSFKLV